MTNLLKTTALVLILGSCLYCQPRKPLTTVKQSANPPEHITFVFTLDGLGYEILNSIPEGQRFAKENDVKRLIPPIPVVTFPSHATLIFGTDPEEHGVLKNFSTPKEYSNPSHPINPRATKIWQSLAARGVKLQLTAMADLNEYGDIPPLDIDAHAPVSAKFELAMRMLQTGAYQGPIISYIWNEGTDKVGHAYGPDAEETKTRLRELLAELNTIKKKIQDMDPFVTKRVSFIFASDHGMATLTQCTPFLSKRESDDFSHGASYVLLKTDKAVSMAQELLSTSFKDATLKLYHNPDLRIKGVFLLPEGWRFDNAGKDCEILAKGNHTFDPSKYPSQHGVFWDWSNRSDKPSAPRFHAELLQVISGDMLQ